MTNENPLGVEITNFGNGNIRFQRGTPGSPATSETTGNVTVNNAAIDPTPSFFEASFNIHVSHVLQGAKATSHVMVNIPIPEEEAESSYLEIEDKAARQLAPMLRTLADLIEADIERAANERLAREAE